MNRCSWPGTNEQMIRYHDEEWGMPCHDDRKLFEYIVLDTFQAGLSWAIVLNKREGFRKAFDNFNPEKIALYHNIVIQRLKNNPEIIRNKLKIAATVTNAQAFLAIQKEFGSFDRYIWQFVYPEQGRGVGGKPLVNSPKEDSHIASSSKESDAMSADLKKRGFKFVGTTICYAFMQGAGLVNDHTTNCFRYNDLKNAK